MRALYNNVELKCTSNIRKQKVDGRSTSRSTVQAHEEHYSTVRVGQLYRGSWQAWLHGKGAPCSRSAHTEPATYRNTLATELELHSGPTPVMRQHMI
jgi:hypothetical protein